MSAPVTLQVEIQINAVWYNITGYVRSLDGITIKHGASSEGGTADPSECHLTLANSDGRFTPENPTGPYYGYLGRETTIKVLAGGTVRFIGGIAEFRPTWDPSGALVDMGITAAGPLRRLARGVSSASVFKDYIVGRSALTGNIIGYWPMDDGPTSTYFASALPGGAPLTFIGTPILADVDPGPEYASTDIPSFAGAGAYGSAPAHTQNGLSLGALVSIPAGGTTNDAELLRLYTDGTAAVWTLSYDTTNAIRVRAYNSAGTVVLNTTTASVPWVDATYLLYLELKNNGANIDWYVTILGLAGSGSSLAGHQIGNAGTIMVGANQQLTGEVGIGHVILGKTNTAISQGGAAEDAMLGYTRVAGFINSDAETVEERMQRLADSADVDLVLESGSIVDESMGADPGGGVLTRMRIAEAADVGGILSDDIDALGLRYITRAGMYSDTQDAGTVDLTYSQIAPPLVPVIDDQVLINDVTVGIDGGAQGRAVQQSGPLNVNPYPTGVGRYEDSKSLALAYDEDPGQYAAWLLSVGTTDGTRYPSVTVDLVRNPALSTVINTLRPGHWIKLSGLPAWLPPTEAELIVRGWTETLSNYERRVDLVCTPAAPYRVLELESQEFGRLDSATTVTNEVLDSTETGVDYTGDTWITTATRPGDFPFHIVIGGEVMRVTAATGSTFTVVRSVNGVVKGHATSAPIRLAYPVHLAL